MVKKKKLTQYEKISSIFNDFYLKVHGIDDEHIKSLYLSWKASKENIESAGESINKSALTIGLKQGLREMPILLQGVSKSYKREVASIFNSVLCENYPEFVKYENEKLDLLIHNGAIKNESDYYFVCYIIDIMECKENCKDELITLYSLLNSFEDKS